MSIYLCSKSEGTLKHKPILPKLNLCINFLKTLFSVLIWFIIIHGVLYTLNIAKPAFIYVITSFISFNFILIVKKISTSKFTTWIKAKLKKIFLCGPFKKSLLNLLQYCFCFMFCFFGHEPCGILVPQPGIKPTPLGLEGKVLSTVPPTESPKIGLLTYT